MTTAHTYGLNHIFNIPKYKFSCTGKPKVYLLILALKKRIVCT